jgi:hypothetical protein
MMTDRELVQTLKTAAESVKDNIPLYILLLMAAERIEEIENENRF